MKKVLIINAVPVNNGDAALVFSLYRKLGEKGLEVAVATHRYGLVQKYYPEVRLERDVLDYPLVKRAGAFKRVLLPLLLPMLKAYREADVIVGAPGGYVNSYYGIFDKFFIIFIAKLLGKKTAIYSQSIGPLNERDSRYFAFFSRFIDLMYVRDQLSEETTTSLAPTYLEKRLTEDAAFLLEPDFSRRPPSKKVAVSVRDWFFDDRSTDRYYAIIAELVRACVAKGYAVEFVSTCQGVPGYIDDSDVAEKIQVKLLKDVPGVTVRRGRYTLDEFRAILKQYDFVIGTRLHMCILSLLSGVPALNISYEVKGRECYAYLGLSNLSVDYNSDRQTALSALESLLGNLDPLRDFIETRITASHLEAVRHFDYFCSKMELQ